MCNITAFRPHPGPLPQEREHAAFTQSFCANRGRFGIEMPKHQAFEGYFRLLHLLSYLRLDRRCYSSGFGEAGWDGYDVVGDCIIYPCRKPANLTGEVDFHERAVFDAESGREVRVEAELGGWGEFGDRGGEAGEFLGAENARAGDDPDLVFGGGLDAGVGKWLGGFA